MLQFIIQRKTPSCSHLLLVTVSELGDFLQETLLGFGLMVLILTTLIVIMQTQIIASTNQVHTMVMAGLQLIVIAVILAIYVNCSTEVYLFSK